MTNATLAVSRRTLASALDGTCSRLTDCPTAPEGAVRQALTGGGSIIISGMERWRSNAAGEVIEYTEWKMPEERVVGKTPYKNVWWAE